MLQTPTQAAADEAAADNRLDDLVYRISHDLRASVRALQELPTWITEDLADDGIELPDSPRRSLGLIASHARRLDQMLNGLLDYARVGRLQAVSEIDPAKALAEVVEDLGPPRGVTIDARMEDCVVHMGETDLMRLYMVLLTNAIRHTDERPTTITVRGGPVDGAWQLTVTDQGPGIPADQREAVFAPMIKLVSRDKEEGAGMGLAVLRKIAEYNRGTAWIEAGPDGVGTAVHVRIAVL